MAVLFGHRQADDRAVGQLNAPRTLNLHFVEGGEIIDEGNHSRIGHAQAFYLGTGVVGQQAVAFGAQADFLVQNIQRHLLQVEGVITLAEGDAVALHRGRYGLIPGAGGNPAGI